jgi:hypothetical protein
MRKDLLFVLLGGLVVACGGPPKHDGPPTYQDYPVKTYDGPAAPLVLTGSSAEAWRNALTPLLSAGPTFAGRLAVGVTSCGDNCTMSAFVDLKTGVVYRDRAFVPFCFNYDFRPSSTLMIAHPVAMPPGTVRGDCPDVTRYYRWTGDSLALLLELPSAL